MCKSGGATLTKFRKKLSTSEKEHAMTGSVSFPTLQVIRCDTGGWGFQHTSKVKSFFITQLDCVILCHELREVEDPQLPCCKDSELCSEMVGSPFLCTSSTAKLTEILAQEGLDRARLQGFSTTLRLLSEERGEPARCAFTTASGVRVNLCPKASDTFPKQKELVMYVFNFEDLTVYQLITPVSVQLKWFIESAGPTGFPLCFWRTSLTVKPFGEEKYTVEVGDIQRCKHERNAKWIAKLACEVSEKAVRGAGELRHLPLHSEHTSEERPSPEMS